MRVLTRPRLVLPMRHDRSHYPARFVAERMQRMVGMARKLPLPEGTFAVGAGIAVSGVTAYAFQVLAYRQLTTPHNTIDYSAIFGLWVVVFILTPGFFQPLEQEVGRALAHRRAQGIGGGPLVKRAATLGGILALFAVVGSVAAIGPIRSRVFNHDTVLFVSLLIGIVVYYATYIVRGTLAGNGRFGPYGTMLGAEGVIRLIVTIGLVIVGTRTPGPYGLALVLPPIAAMAISLRGQKRLLEPGPTAPYSELSSAIGYLLLGSVLCQALSYSAYLVAISLETHAQATRVGKFAAGILIARIPILGFQAVQAALLPKLARLAGEGRDDEFRKRAPPAADDRARSRRRRRARQFHGRPFRRAPALRHAVHPRQPRSRSARGRERRLHLRPDAGPGVDRPPQLRRRGPCRGSRGRSAAASGSSAPTTSSCGRSSASPSAPCSRRWRCSDASGCGCGRACRWARWSAS